MSEYQYIAFRAIDGPVSEKNLKFMRRQSTRAEITPWAFDNEYDFGDFHGDAVEMLRRGYDFHFHYANFGIRTLMIRLPNGLPDAGAAKPYLDGESLYFSKDKKRGGGILCIEPYFEPGALEEIWEPDHFLSGLIPLRADIINGDLRPLYLAHLAVAGDNDHDPEEEKEGPVPAGLNKLAAAQQALADFYGLSKGLLAAAARKSPAMLGRTIAELRAAAEEMQQELDRKKAEKTARQRAKKLAKMAADPERTLRETERLVKERSMNAYEQAATLLADLRTALAGGEQAGLAEEQARRLREKNPTRHMLVNTLRGKEFLKK